jgi:hypothetical protein
MRTLTRKPVSSGVAGIQRKPTVNKPGDRYEREADQVADWITGGHKRHPAPAGEDLEALGQGGEVDRALNSSGQPLEPATRAFMEPRFNHDFGKVRVHNDDAASASARSLNARAYTLGHDIVFGAGEYTPRTDQGQRLLAHELTHVVQQDSGGMQGSGPAFIQRAAPSLAATITTPAQEAVNALTPNAKGYNVSYLTTDLIEGIVRAEEGVSEARGMVAGNQSIGETQGPGQLGEPEINAVDKTFVTASKQFEGIYGPPPGSWKGKAKDPNWAYFYTAASYLLKLNDAETNFQPTQQLMAKEGAPGTQISNQAMGIRDLGLVTYHGGFDRMAQYRRRIAGDGPTVTHAATAAEQDFQKRFSIAAGFKRWQVTDEMVRDAIHEGLFFADEEDRAKLQEMETYLQNVAGGFDFDFDVAVFLEESRNFYVSGGTVKITAMADFPEGPPGNAPLHYYKYVIQLYSDPSGTFSSRTPYARATYDAGQQQSHTWTSLPPGQYRFSVEKNTGPILHGEGKVEFA